MVTAAIRRNSNITSLRTFLITPLLIGLLHSLWAINMAAAYDCVEAERRCQRDSNCLLAMEAHRVTCGPLGTSCVSADLNLCHAALVGLQLSSAFNGTCWCHEPTMHQGIFRHCLDIHLKMFYHPCIAAINSRVNGRRREELEQQQQQERRRLEEEQRRRDEWRRWHEQQHRMSTSVAPPALVTRGTPGRGPARTTATDNQLIAIKRERERLEHERRLLEQKRQQLIREENERRRQEQQRLRSTTAQYTRQESATIPGTSASLAVEQRTVKEETSGTTGPTEQFQPMPIFVTGMPAIETGRIGVYFTSPNEGVTVAEGPAASWTVATSRHRIRHFQEKVDAIVGGTGQVIESIARGQTPSVVATGETINGHSISDFSNLFSPGHLDRLDGQRHRLKLSVPGEYHWSCTKSLERCLDHIACARLLELYREKCRVDNQRCVSTDWKSCKEAYEGIRWTGLNNCTCSDDHRLHGPSCHFVELLTAHNQCIDQFKRAGHITDDNGGHFHVGLPNASQASTGSSTNTPGSTVTNHRRPDYSPSASGKKHSTPQSVILSSTKPTPTKTVVSPPPIATRPVATTTRRKPSTTTATKSTRKTIPSTTMPTKPPARITTSRYPGRPQGFTSKPQDNLEDEEKDDSTLTSVEKTQVFLLPQRYPMQPVSRLPLVSWEEWDKRRVTASPILPNSAAFRKISNREVGLGDKIYRVDSTCPYAYSHCHWDNTCSWQLSEIKSYCVTICDRQHCSAAISRFYKYVNADFREGLTFCTCRPNDTECMEYQNLLFPSCLRRMQRHEWRECGDLKIECKNDDRCWPWAQKYFDACQWDSDRGRCAVSAHACRQAVLGIRGTPLDTDCACLPNSPECETVQKSLYFRNPCFEEARLTMPAKFTTKRPTKSTTTTTTTTTSPTTTSTTTVISTTAASATSTAVTSTITVPYTTARVTRKRTRKPPVLTRSTTSTSTSVVSVRTLYVEGAAQETTRRTRPPVTTTAYRRKIRTTTTTSRPPRRRPTPPKDDAYYFEEEVTTGDPMEQSSTPENVTETTTMPTTPTTPPPTTTQTLQCIATDQETREYKMQVGRDAVRLYRDRFTRCSSLCLCHENPNAPSELSEGERDEVQTQYEPILACHQIECMENIPCSGATLAGYGAPVFQLDQDRCTCISGDYICRRPPREAMPHDLPDRGLFLSIGYSQKEVNWLAPRYPQEIGNRPVTLPGVASEFVEEIINQLEKRLENILGIPGQSCKLVELNLKTGLETETETETKRGNNFIFQVKLAVNGLTAQEYDYEDYEEEIGHAPNEVCRRPVKMLVRALDGDEYRNDPILSVIKEAVVDDRLPSHACTQILSSWLKLFLVYCIFDVAAKLLLADDAMCTVRAR